jgi:hypothetical protein
MGSYEIYWDDLNFKAKEKLNELYHKNVDLTPLCVIEFEDNKENKEKFVCDECGCFFWVESRNEFECPNCNHIKKHNKLREILIDYGNDEYGDAIIDEICDLFNYPKTDNDEEAE